MITSKFKPGPGRFLVSEPFMGDPNFRRTVVLLVEHGEDGSLGFVMNRQLKAGIQEIVEDLDDFDSPVFLGGPVEQNTLHYVHRLGEQLSGSRHISGDLYWSGDFDQLKEMIRSGEASEEEVLFFVGYSGWSPGQLFEELERKSWIIAPQNDAYIFDGEYEDLWKNILRGMGEKYRVISNYPVDPRLN